MSRPKNNDLEVKKASKKKVRFLFRLMKKMTQKNEFKPAYKAKFNSYLLSSEYETGHKI